MFCGRVRLLNKYHTVIQNHLVVHWYRPQNLIPNTQHMHIIQWGNAVHFSKGFAGNRVLGYTLNAQVCWQMQCRSLHLCEKTSNSCLLDRQMCVFSRASFVKHTWVIGKGMKSSLDEAPVLFAPHLSPHMFCITLGFYVFCVRVRLLNKYHTVI